MKTRVVKINKSSPEIEKIKEAVLVLEKSGLVAFPTETVYGLGTNSRDKRAIKRLYEVKGRPEDKPFSLLVPNIYSIDDFAVDVLPFAYRLADRFWPGPLTLILKSKDSLTIGLRMPNAAVALEIIKAVTFPIACPSANLSGKRPPVSAEDVLEDLDGKIELVLDGGHVQLGVSSTVVDASALPVKILRKGSIDEKSIQEIATKKRIMFVCTGNSCRSVMAKALFEKMIRERGREDIEVASAGIAAPTGLMASTETKQLLMDEGIDVSEHRAQRVTGDLLKRSDLIFVMQRFQEEAVLRDYGFLKGRVYLLKEFSKFDHNELEIDDPIGKGMEFYKNCFFSIKQALERLIELI